MQIFKKCWKYTPREAESPLSFKWKLERVKDKRRKKRTETKIEMIFKRLVTVILILMKIILNNKCKRYWEGVVAVVEVVEVLAAFRMI